MVLANLTDACAFHPKYMQVATLAAHPFALLPVLYAFWHSTLSL